VLYNNFKRGRNKPHVPCSNRQAVFYQLQTPGRFNKDHAESQECIPAVTKLIREALQGIQFLEPRPSAMRDYAHAKLNQLKEDGSNLSGVLYSLCQDEEATSIANRQAILDFIRSLPEQDIEDVDFIRTERNDVMVRLKETFGGQSRTVDAPLLSDGTLRVLAVAAALLSADKGSLVILEEIDNGIHPSRADKLVAQIEKIARRRDLRVLLTSHNPALLDALPVHALADVLCCYRDPDQGYSSVVRLGDLERYPELIAQGPLGQLMTDRVLDRFIKDKTTNAQRKQRQFSWLEALEDASAGQ
jgi:predicted ATPase